MNHIPSDTLAPGDPAGCWYDMHALPEPDGAWAHEVDDRGVSYGAGDWPYYQDGSPRGVFLTPDVRYYAWRNHIVLAAPTGEHTAKAIIHLYVRPYGTGAILFDLTIAINLVTGIATVPAYCPHPLREQAETKAQKVIEHLAAARTDRARRRVTVTAYDRWQAAKTRNPTMTNQQPDDRQPADMAPIDWAAAAVFQHQNNKQLIYRALGNIGPLDANEVRFISRIAYDGGFLELASLADQVRSATSVTPHTTLDIPS